MVMVPLRLQLLGLTLATLLLLTTTWSKWEPGTAFHHSSTIRIVVSKALDAVTSETPQSPQTPRHRLVTAAFQGKDEHLGGQTIPTRNLIDTDISIVDSKDGAIDNIKKDGQLTSHSVGTDAAIAEALKEKINLWRPKLRMRLHSAKKAIARASITDVDTSLNSEVYHNVTAFSKSYQLMEKIFRIYMYKEGKKPFVHMGPEAGIYASEGQFIKHMRMKNNPYVVHEPWRAQMFFMPYSVKQMEANLYVPESQSIRPITNFINEYVDAIKSIHPFWNMKSGADHFFVSCHDWGPRSAGEHNELSKNAVKVVCNADTSSEHYSPQRDISLPEINIHYLVKPSHIGGPGVDERPTLAFFAGQMHGHVRPILIQHWQNDSDMKVSEVLENEMKKPDYIENMRTSKYCICAEGFEVNSPRIVESIYQDCVPVILADHLVLPFQDTLNWEKFSVTVPEVEIPNLKKILTHIPDTKYREMQQRLKDVRQHFLWNDRLDVKYDVFHMILHSIWSSRLQWLEATSVDIKHDVHR